MLGFQTPPEHELKARVVVALHRAIVSQRLTQAEAAKRIGYTNPIYQTFFVASFAAFL
jgi:hypothetical protein